jgi:glycosyltransferase involved in cell wall biosynthesis
MFSIVIPLYNKSHTIVNTLTTVLNQTYKDFEVVIVNDGSTDHGVEIIKNNFSDNRLIIINQTNQGVSAARNRGVAEAQFELIAFLDGDDELLPNYLFEMNKAVLKFPEAGMYCCAGIIREADGSKHLRFSNQFQNNIQQINYFENPYFFSNSSSTIIRKSSFKKTSGFPLGMKINEDLVFFCSLALITSVVYCPIPLSVYVRGVEGQATGNKSSLHKYVVERTNLVFENWLKSDRKNLIYLIFTKYEIRNEFINYLKQNNDEKVHYLITHLHPQLLNLFSKAEIFLYQHKKLRFFAILFIYCTKIRWKLRNFPITNYKKL